MGRGARQARVHGIARVRHNLVLFFFLSCIKCFPGGSAVKYPPANAGGRGLIPGSGRFPGEGNGNPLQYSCLGILKDRGAWQATVYGVAKESDMT